ncbi:hypothetical protein TIFTF001_036203 [Ficus carica]|uniref:Uncharacterized protein n=1 Tax=Ficus carica TaxID=3494 RepID=A0AA88E4T5_FICCA|nr:hypothetical protein TIFTF001_036203 [Ficus carica]
MSVSHGFGYLGNPDRSYSEWYRQVDMLWVTSTVSVRSGGGGCRRSRHKDKYSDKYQMSGVRWCRVVGVARSVTIRLPTGTRRRGKGSMCQPSRKRLSCGWGSVARVSTLEPDGDMLEIFSSGRTKEPTGSRAPRSPINWWFSMLFGREAAVTSAVGSGRELW